VVLLIEGNRAAVQWNNDTWTFWLRACRAN